jgi:hypothetical protein
MWIKFSVRNLNIMLINILEFSKIDVVKGVNKISHYVIQFSSGLDKIRRRRCQKNVLCDPGFRKIWVSEIHTLVCHIRLTVSTSYRH